MNLFHKNYLLACIFLIVHQHTHGVHEQPITLFCHGIVNNKEQVNLFKGFIQEPYTSFNFPDAMPALDWDLNSLIYQTGLLCNKKINRNNMAMGHGIDITTLHNQIDPQKEYILYGLSRGGATIIKYMAEYNPENIKAIIIDSAPADVVESVYDLQKDMGSILTSDRNTMEYIFHQVFPAYPMHSISPLAGIFNIQNKDIPIFIVHSHEDTRVSISSAWKMYLKFIEYGFKHVYLCELNHGYHGFITQGAEQEKYLHHLHTFYKKYNLSYNPSYATTLPLPQPSSENIIEKLDQHNQKLNEAYHKKNQFLTKVAAANIFLLILLLYQKHQ